MENSGLCEGKNLGEYRKTGTFYALLGDVQYFIVSFSPLDVGLSAL